MKVLIQYLILSSLLGGLMYILLVVVDVNGYKLIPLMLYAYLFITGFLLVFLSNIITLLVIRGFMKKRGVKNVQQDTSANTGVDTRSDTAKPEQEDAPRSLGGDSK